MNPFDFFRKLEFANDPLGAQVNQLWKTTKEPLLICWYLRASTDGRRDEEIRVVLSATMVAICSATRRTGYQWQEQELKSGSLARRLLRLFEGTGMLEQNIYPHGPGNLAAAVLAVSSGRRRLVARMDNDSAELLRPVGLLWELEHPGSELRRKLDDEFFPRVLPVLKTPTPDAAWEVDPGICLNCDRRLTMAEWSCRGRTAEGGTLCPGCARISGLTLVDRQGDGVNGFREIMVRQVMGQGRRKLLESKEFYFVVFLDADGGATGFHLSDYEKGNMVVWKDGVMAEAFRTEFVGSKRLHEIQVRTFFDAGPALENLKACGGNIRPPVMAALREGLESLGRLSPESVGA